MTLREAKKIVRDAGYALREGRLSSFDEFVADNGGIDEVGVFETDDYRGRDGRSGYIAVKSTGSISRLNSGITVYPFYELKLPSGKTDFNLQGGWGVRKGQVKALLDLVDKIGMDGVPDSYDE